MKEEKAVILDFLAEGYPDRRHPEPVAQSIGTSNFTLLELVPREDIELTVEEEVYIGEGKRDKIRYIKGSMKVADLTNVARSNLGRTVTDIVKKNEEKFIESLSEIINQNISKISKVSIAMPGFVDVNESKYLYGPHLQFAINFSKLSNFDNLNEKVMVVRKDKHSYVVLALFLALF